MAGSDRLVPRSTVERGLGELEEGGNGEPGMGSAREEHEAVELLVVVRNEGDQKEGSSRGRLREAMIYETEAAEGRSRKW